MFEGAHPDAILEIFSLYCVDGEVAMYGGKK